MVLWSAFYGKKQINNATSTTGNSYTFREVTCMEFKELSMPKVAALLATLIGEQEGAEITYKDFVLKEEFEKKEDKTA